MKWPFGRKALSAAEIIGGSTWMCAGCDTEHHGLPDLAALAPDNWTLDRTYQPNSEMGLDGNFLSEDFCVIDGTIFAVRCVLPIPIIGSSREFAIGCWASLSRDSFMAYLDNFDSGDFPESSGWFAWLLNDLKPWMDGTAIACNIFARPDRQRPYLFVQDDVHPLARSQDDGLSPDAILDLFSIYGHHLTR